MNSKLKELEDERNDKEDNLEKMKHDLEEKQDQINKFKLVEIELLNKLEKCKGTLKGLNQTIEQNKEELDALVIGMSNHI